MTLFQVDAFTNQLFGGNPAAVIPLEEWLTDGLMQQIAEENNLSETAFLVKEAEGYRIRWFTPVKEVNLCGHATLATAHVLKTELGYEGQHLTLNSLSGPLGVRFDDGKYTLDFPADILEPFDVIPRIVESIGLQPKQCLQGKEDILVIVDRQSQVESLDPNFYAIEQLGGRGLIVSAPGEEVDFVSRCFYPAYGIPEDPVTGSAHTTLTPYWAVTLGKDHLTARQLSKRGGELECRLKDDRVEISGECRTYMIGKIEIGGQEDQRE